MKPERGELVVGEVREVHSNSVEIKLLEYGMKGLLNVSNIPGLWIRDIKKSFRKGQLIVCKILKIDHTTELSLKGVSKYHKEKRLKEYGRERKMERMFKKVAEENKIKPELVEKTITNLKQEHGSLFNAIKKLRGGEDLGLGEEFSGLVERFKIGEKEYEFKGTLELHSDQGNGLEIIKDSLKELKNARASYLGDSQFLVKLKTKNPKKGEKNLKEEANKAISRIESLKGFGEFKMK